jgi:hypothetical protein
MDLDNKPTKEQIEQEIREIITSGDKPYGQPNGTFLPDEYRKNRRQGYTREYLEYDYDMCHVWR